MFWIKRIINWKYLYKYFIDNKIGDCGIEYIGALLRKKAIMISKLDVSSINI